MIAYLDIYIKKKKNIEAYNACVLDVEDDAYFFRFLRTMVSVNRHWTGTNQMALLM